MSATATRPANNALDQRRLGIAMAAAILAVGLLVAATVSRQLTVPTTPAAPVTVAAAHDHGWATSSSAEKGFVYTGIPYTAPVAEEPAYIGYPSLGRELIVSTENGGIRYTGIPYPAAGANAQDGVNGMQKAQ